MTSLVAAGTVKPDLLLFSVVQTEDASVVEWLIAGAADRDDVGAGAC